LQAEVYQAAQVAGSGYYVDDNSEQVKQVRRDAEPLMVDGELTGAEVIQLVQEAYEVLLAELAETD
jgi:hypothetical protein